jgi:hypothetical protein
VSQRSGCTGTAGVAGIKRSLCVKHEAGQHTGARSRRSSWPPSAISTGTTSCGSTVRSATSHRLNWRPPITVNWARPPWSEPTARVSTKARAVHGAKSDPLVRAWRPDLLARTGVGPIVAAPCCAPGPTLAAAALMPPSPCWAGPLPSSPPAPAPPTPRPRQEPPRDQTLLDPLRRPPALRLLETVRF